MDIILKKEIEFELGNQRKAVFVSAAVVLVMAALVWIWVAVASLFPPPVEKTYQLIGLADFGIDDKGNGDINNFLAPSDNPGSGTPGDPLPTANSNPAQNNAAPVQDNPVITQDAPSNHQATPSNPTETNPSNSSTANPSDNQAGTNGNDVAAGSNHGSSGETGDRGNPNSNVLNPNGMFDIQGMGTRKWLDLPLPVYQTQQEAKILFEFTIAPDGSVKYVKPPITTYSELKRAGMAAIYKWKFDAVDDGKDQNTKVTITFRLN